MMRTIARRMNAATVAFVASRFEADQSSDGHRITFEVASKATIAADPGEPIFWEDFETDGSGSRHHRELPCAGAPDNERHLLSSIAAVGKDTLDKREQPSRLKYYASMFRHGSEPRLQK